MGVSGTIDQGGMNQVRGDAMRVSPLHFECEQEVLRALKGIGVDPYGIEAMLPKMRHHTILLRGIECKVANIIKQEMLSLGGDAAVTRNSVACCVPETDVILMGTQKQILRFTEKIAKQPFGLGALSVMIQEAMQNISRKTLLLKTSAREVQIGERTLIMGILNATPDSFSDGGRFPATDMAVEEGVRMVEGGADMIDIGGESSRPGADPVSEEEELRRVIPILRGLSRRVCVPISVDTMKSAVARAALADGAEIINDISAMNHDKAMAKVIADAGAGVILMHMRGNPKTMQAGDLTYRSLMGEIGGYLLMSISKAGEAGISPVQIMVDPGIGFGKSPADNLRLIRQMKELKVLGRPIVTGASRKSFIGHVIGGGPLERLEGTAAAVTVAIMNGSRIMRVHDVASMKKVASMADALTGDASDE
jgi:dihydropteroate synthase